MFDSLSNSPRRNHPGVLLQPVWSTSKRAIMVDRKEQTTCKCGIYRSKQTICGAQSHSRCSQFSIQSRVCPRIFEERLFSNSRFQDLIRIDDVDPDKNKLEFTSSKNSSLVIWPIYLSNLMRRRIRLWAVPLLRLHGRARADDPVIGKQKAAEVGGALSTKDSGKFKSNRPARSQYWKNVPVYGEYKKQRWTTRTED